jgi:hypothetical protein
MVLLALYVMHPTGGAPYRRHHVAVALLHDGRSQGKLKSDGLSRSPVEAESARQCGDHRMGLSDVYVTCFQDILDSKKEAIQKMLTAIRESCRLFHSDQVRTCCRDPRPFLAHGIALPDSRVNMYRASWTVSPSATNCRWKTPSSTPPQLSIACYPRTRAHKLVLTFAL